MLVMKKNVINIGKICLLAIALECFVFNFSFIKSLVNASKIYNVEYHLENMSMIHWTQMADGFYSDEDPQLIIENVDTKVDSINIQYHIEGHISQITLYYTNTENQSFDAGFGVQADSVLQDNTNIKVDGYVKDLRVDLGEEPNLLLNDVTVVINPVTFCFSWSRFIAVLMIYLSAKGLFHLQSPLDFSLEEIE